MTEFRLLCPECHKPQDCPCPQCREQHGKDVVWENMEIDGMCLTRCGHCGFAMSDDGWVKEFWEQVKEKRATLAETATVGGE